MAPGNNDRLLSIPEAIQALRISQTHFLRLKREGIIVRMRLGHRTLIPSREIARLIDSGTTHRRRGPPGSYALAAPAPRVGGDRSGEFCGGHLKNCGEGKELR